MPIGGGGQYLALPKYRILSQSGEAHEQWFKVECDLGELALISTGDGGSRRAAEQQAAEAALVLLEQKLAAGKKKS
ncbi:putative dsRNA-binding protein [Chromobacterium piscinae]|uniref:putative dsRNA-binding protein n=1 Tax=Chromobacterium piscinae TaxID=686831 RepID=UPI0031FC85EF